MNLRQVGKKIKSVGNVKKITKAMQLVSAVKMKKAQAAAHEAKPYQEFLELAISRIKERSEVSLTEFFKAARTSGQKELLIIVTSNKGLCGSFNFNLLRYLLKNNPVSSYDYVTVGKKGANILGQMGAKIVADYSVSAADSVSALFELALEKYIGREYSKVSLLYNRFVSSLRSDPELLQLLPFSLEEDQGPKSAAMHGYYLIEPDPTQVIEELLKTYIEQKIRFAILQSTAGEHSARMIAMQNATDNAVNIIYNLTIAKNKLRQEKITYELLDMITAKESVSVS